MHRLRQGLPQCSEIGHEVGGEDRLKTVEGKAGKGQPAQFGHPQDACDGGDEIREVDRVIGCTFGIEPAMQWLQQQDKEPAGCGAHQHRATPAQRLRYRGAEPATEQDTCGNGSLRDGEGERCISPYCPSAQQLGTGGGGDGSPAIADQRGQDEPRRTTDNRDRHAAAN